ncbi:MULTISPECIES: AAA family ATPase [Brevibacillus]|jgi:MoxR-like ATPase|uniref:AAA family ATPase n=1 Tax=Brevibacillus TaxID=55080 RepID=UPI00057C024D|nr:MoxR family ATPase [Brevibacillus borstelensis]MBE5395758.1 MoxR family ATPase [Brevibacillus borstelensis]MED1744286.1 MoxR family ATPase [Brevibacillus borstelensis]MED1874135.1 MoxR family ATPase [Brevibacillus borstelensis]MED1885708.1 MoxR family ATPase [Brevibacillus borstelensis]RNB63147.1 MoxR family ATPase [Brevibacillus borstelensis]
MAEQQAWEECLQRVERVREEIGKVLVGQREVVDQLLWAVFAGGHALLEGVPGLGKTLLVKTLSQAFELSFQRIQFTPDLMPTDITGTNILSVDETGQQSFQFQRGPIFAHVVLADEINRATPKTQSALLEAMQERTVSAGGVTRALPDPFFVLATQNPLEQEGTYPLPEAQMDRFLLKIEVPFPTADELKEIVLRTTAGQGASVEKVASAREIADIQQAARDILVADAVLSYAVKLLLATHPGEQAIHSVNRYVRSGAGPRGVQAMVALAKVRALLSGRFNLSFEDIDAVALPALRHRVFLNFEGEANGIRPDSIVQEILAGLEKERA